MKPKRNGRNRWRKGPTTVGQDMAPMADSMLSWITKLAAEGAKEGLREDGSWVRRTDEGAPSRDPSCPNHPDISTRWRGPLPGRGDAPVVEEKGYTFVVTPREGENRAREASRLWRIADVYANRPSPFGGEHLIWQAAPCMDCLDARQLSWLDEIWPPPPEKRARGARSEEGDGDWEL